MRRVSENDIEQMAGDAIPPLLAKSEEESTESAFALKRLPQCYVLGVSCDVDERLELYVIDDEASAWKAYEICCARMLETGRPFPEVSG